ncbi:MAG: PT domain-containing protein [Eubacterium sp.]
MLDAGNTFYIEYSGVYNKDNTKGYLNKNETAGNVYGGVYKFNPNTLNKDAYNTVKLQSNGKNVYIIIKYGNPTEAPDISDYEGEVETPDPKLPTEATGLALGNPKYNVLMVLFNDADKTKEQTYNVYVDGEKKLSEVKAGMHTIEEIGAGRVTVKVTAVYNNKESEGVSGKVKITGKVVEKPTEAPTEKPTEKPTVDPTNKPTERPSETTAKQDGVSTVQSTTKAQGVKKTTVKPSVKLGRTKVKKAVIKKKAATKINISFKKIKGATKYRIQISKTKKFKKVLIKKTVKKVSFTFKNKKLKKYRKLYVRVKAVGAVKWSKPKKVKFK